MGFGSKLLSEDQRQPEIPQRAGGGAAKLLLHSLITGNPIAFPHTKDPVLRAGPKRTAQPAETFLPLPVQERLQGRSGDVWGGDRPRYTPRAECGGAPALEEQPLLLFPPPPTPRAAAPAARRAGGGNARPHSASPRGLPSPQTTCEKKRAEGWWWCGLALPPPPPFLPSRHLRPTSPPSHTRTPLRLSFPRELLPSSHLIHRPAGQVQHPQE